MTGRPTKLTAEHAMQPNQPMQSTPERCGAKTRSGKPCQSYAMANGRCRMHGGKAHRGIMSATYKDGRYSKYIPANLKADYEKSLGDPKLLSFDEDVALLESMALDALRRADTSDSAKAWHMAKAAFIVMVEAMANSDINGTIKGRETLRAILNDMTAKYAARDEAVDLILKKSRLANDERKRQIEQQQLIAVERVMLIVTAIIAGIKESVYKHADRTTGNKILSDTSAQLGRIFEGGGS